MSLCFVGLTPDIEKADSVPRVCIETRANILCSPRIASPSLTHTITLYPQPRSYFMVHHTACLFISAFIIHHYVTLHYVLFTCLSLSLECNFNVKRKGLVHICMSNACHTVSPK